MYRASMSKRKKKRILCVHGKRKRRCKVCGGKGICNHGRQKYQCKDCNGAGICKHQRRRCLCKTCWFDGKEGGSFCKHARHNKGQFCKKCGGKGICRHGLRKNRCGDCKEMYWLGADNDGTKLIARDELLKRAAVLRRIAERQVESTTREVYPLRDVRQCMRCSPGGHPVLL